MPFLSYISSVVKKANLDMRYCPECGGELQYASTTKRYVCKSCGLSLTPQELIELRDKLRPSFETEEEQHQKERKEYLKWWLSKKK
jgi:ribosomal protein S27AE